MPAPRSESAGFSIREFITNKIEKRMKRKGATGYPQVRDGGRHKQDPRPDDGTHTDQCGIQQSEFSLQPIVILHPDGKVIL